MESNDAKIAVVTGASRGIGEATALALADAGFAFLCKRNGLLPGWP